MKLSKLFLALLFASILVVPFNGLCQNVETIDSTETKVLQVAREIMHAATTCALITIDEEGNSRVRTMDPFPAEENFTIWLGTNKNSRKVKQIKQHPVVSLYYLDGDATGYVVIQGKAELVNDKQAKEKWWKKKWEAFYPNKTDNYLLIKITPQWMEVSSTTRGVYSDTKTWQPPKVVFD